MLDLVIDAAHGLGLTDLDRQQLAKLAVEREHSVRRVAHIAQHAIHRLNYALLFQRSRYATKRTRIIDTSRELSGGRDAFYRVLPPGDTLAFSARTRAWDGSVVWTEIVLEDDQPSWENNLNWWMVDSSVVDAPRTASATTYRREMRALMVDAKSEQLIVVRTDRPA